MEKNKSFTLIELLVVITIIAILSSMIIVSLGTIKEKARITRVAQFSTSIYHTLSDKGAAVWRFDEGDGQMANDSSGNRNNATLGPTDNTEGTDPTWQNDPYLGSVLRFGLNPGGTFAWVPDSSSLDITDKITIEAWIKTDKVNNYGDCILSKETEAAEVTYRIRFEIPYEAPKLKLTLCFEGGGYPPCKSSPGIPWNNSLVGHFHHIAFTYDGSKMCAYLDGKMSEPCESVSGSRKIKTNNKPLYIGCCLAGSGDFGGAIKNIRIYNDAF